jgi:Phage capsid protein
VSNDGLYQLYTTQFTTVLELKLQQMGSKLRGKVREGFHVGKQASPVNQIGAIQLKAPAGRFAPIQRTDPDFTRRWVFPQDGELAQQIDTFDELKTIVDPKSQYSDNASMAVGRAWDDCIIANAFATSQVGQDAAGLTAETFATSTFQIASTFGAGATSVGLTVAKFIEAKRIFRHYHVDLDSDPLCMVIGSTQESDLLKQVQVVSTEFNDRPVLTDGRITRFLGFDIVLSERLQVSSNIRNVIAFSKSGLYLGIWKDMTNIASQRNDLSGHPYQIYTMVSFGATRTQPGKVLQIQCADTQGADITP